MDVITGDDIFQPAIRSAYEPAIRMAVLSPTGRFDITTGPDGVVFLVTQSDFARHFIQFGPVAVQATTPPVEFLPNSDPWGPFKTSMREMSTKSEPVIMPDLARYTPSTKVATSRLKTHVEHRGTQPAYGERGAL